MNPAIEVTLDLLGPDVKLQIGIPVQATEQQCLHVINGMLLRAVVTPTHRLCIDCLRVALANAGRPL